MTTNCVNGNSTAKLHPHARRKETRLKRYLNRCHSLIRSLEPCFTSVVPYLTVDDLAQFSVVCGILNNWMLADVVWRKSCLSQTQYAPLIKKHLNAETWYQLTLSLYHDNFNPFKSYIPRMHGGCVPLLTECLRSLLDNVRRTVINDPSFLQLSRSPTALFDTEWLFRCCVSLRNDRHGAVPQGLLPRLFQNNLKHYCTKHCSKDLIPLSYRTLRWLVSEWHIYMYIIDRLSMLSQKIDDHNYQYDPTKFLPPAPHQMHHPHYASYYSSNAAVGAAAAAAAAAISGVSNHPCIDALDDKGPPAALWNVDVNSIPPPPLPPLEPSIDDEGNKPPSDPSEILRMLRDGKSNGTAGMEGPNGAATTTTTTTRITKRKRKRGIEQHVVQTTRHHQCLQSSHHSNTNPNDAFPLPPPPTPKPQRCKCGKQHNSSNNQALLRLQQTLYGHPNMSGNNGFNMSMNSRKFGLSVSASVCSTTTTTTHTSSKKGGRVTVTTTTSMRNDSNDATNNSSHHSHPHCNGDNHSNSDHITPKKKKSSLCSCGKHPLSDDNVLFHASELDRQIFNKLALGMSEDMEKFNVDSPSHHSDSPNGGDPNTAMNGTNGNSTANLSNSNGSVNANGNGNNNNNSNSSNSSNNNKCSCGSCSINFDGPPMGPLTARAKNGQLPLPPPPPFGANKYTCVMFDDDKISMTRQSSGGSNGSGGGSNAKNIRRNNLISNNATPDLTILPSHLALFGKHFLCLDTIEGVKHWRQLCGMAESENEYRLLAEVSIIFDSLGILCPKRWMPDRVVKRNFYQYSNDNLNIYYRGSHYILSRSAASLSPYIREYMSRDWHSTVDLSWIDGDSTHLSKLLTFLEYHIKQPMSHIPTPVRSRNLKKVVPMWYAKFALDCDRKDCFVMILIGNALAIAPLVHLFCARIATMIKSLKPDEVREIMSLENHGGNGGGAAHSALQQNTVTTDDSPSNSDSEFLPSLLNN